MRDQGLTSDSPHASLPPRQEKTIRANGAGMSARLRGSFVISWDQTETDGLRAAAPALLGPGSVWSWHGEATRVDGGADIMLLEHARGHEELHQRAAGQIRRILASASASAPGLAAPPSPSHPSAPDTGMEEPLLFRSSFELTDGSQSYFATLIGTGEGQRPLVLFPEFLPPKSTELWVVSSSIGPEFAERARPGPPEGGTLCFLPGTLIETPAGQRPVEALAEDDLVITRDGGARPICWIGRRRISGGRLMAMPHLRPIRFLAGALGGGPESDLLLSPDHRVLLKGPVASELFGTAEVLVAARDLVNDRDIRIERQPREIEYIHLMLERHEILMANGISVESFHPADAALERIAPEQRARLFSRLPKLEEDPAHFGAHARRALTRPEAALMAHALAPGRVREMH